MGIETAAALGTAAAAGGTAAAAGGAAAAGATALTAAELGAAGATAAELGSAAVAADAGLAGAAAAGTAGATSAIVPGSLEVANMVGAAGGDALGAFVSANGGFGTMTAAQSIGGMVEAVNASPLIEGLQTAGKAMSAASAASAQGAQPAKRYNGPQAQDPGRVNQNPGLTQTSGLMQGINQDDYRPNLGGLGFEDGGVIERQQYDRGNLFSNTRRRREIEAGLGDPYPTPSNVVVNVGTSQQEQEKPKQQPSPAPTEADQRTWAGDLLHILRQFGMYADGGQIPQLSNHTTPEGEIKGPKSKSGADNQTVKVAGGEGVIPVDVMDVPGVADLLQGLIQTFHTPVKKG